MWSCVVMSQEGSFTSAVRDARDSALSRSHNASGDARKPKVAEAGSHLEDAPPLCAAAVHGRALQ
jgi:hypothetical protein